MMTASAIAALARANEKGGKKMKVKCNYTFTFSQEEVNTIRKMWELMRDMEDYEYCELLRQAESADFFDELDNLLIFAENNME